MAMTLDRQIPIFAAMQTPVETFTDDLCGMQTTHRELLLPRLLPQQIEIGIRHSIQKHEEDTGLVEKAVAWILAPVFFCCVVAEKAKPPHTWEATEVFSRVVISFMLKLFVLATNLTRGQLK
ncbi:hypothetical protein JG688_00011856 [Phytophthora aleatoria]|uniref:Uncharacterized protein n=1 Tax=Phytophthora aleatoria TaxID=2496075 RepID=A0A8J5M507_9STRA|nr:hypothetical protein JG688_00011856 [Phytophthora aleatoria]